MDPRPTVVVENDTARVRGAACARCGHVVARPGRRCRRCSGDLVEADFGPGGVVYAATVVRIPVGDRTPPFTLAYVDLDDGPRVLAHVDQLEVPPVGTAVNLVGLTAAGDPLVKASA